MRKNNPTSKEEICSLDTLALLNYVSICLLKASHNQLSFYEHLGNTQFWYSVVKSQPGFQIVPRDLLKQMQCYYMAIVSIDFQHVASATKTTPCKSH